MGQEYEIKYAIAVINKPGKVSFYTHGEDKIVGYIVSKVIVAREVTTYNKGVEYKAYDVLLPYVDISNRREEVVYDKDGNPVNTTRLYKVYDTYEEAAKDRDELNKQLRFVIVSNELQAKKNEDLYFQYNAQMKECNIFESVIETRCKDLKPRTMQRVLAV